MQQLASNLAYLVNIELKLHGGSPSGTGASATDQQTQARCKDVSDAMWQSLADLTGMAQFIPGPKAKTLKKGGVGKRMRPRNTRRSPSKTIYGKKTRKHPRCKPSRKPRKTRRSE